MYSAQLHNRHVIIRFEIEYYVHVKCSNDIDVEKEKLTYYKYTIYVCIEHTLLCKGLFGTYVNFDSGHMKSI